jgi:hypothetical protein
MKTNRGLEWYQSKAYDLLYCRQIVFFYFYRFCPFKLKKQFSASYKTFE